MAVNWQSYTFNELRQDLLAAWIQSCAQNVQIIPIILK